MCRYGTERKRRRMVVEDTEEHMGRIFFAYGTPLTEVLSFWYLVITLLSSGDNWLVVEQNLWRARVKWVRLAKILGREG